MSQDRPPCDSDKRLRYRLSDWSQPRRKTASKNGYRNIDQGITQAIKNFDQRTLDDCAVLFDVKVVDANLFYPRILAGSHHTLGWRATYLSQEQAADNTLKYYRPAVLSITHISMVPRHFQQVARAPTMGRQLKGFLVPRRFQWLSFRVDCRQRQVPPSNREFSLL